MSVHGELQRLCGDVIATLEGASDAAAFVAALSAAQAQASDDATGAASAVKQACADAGVAPVFGRSEQKQRYHELREHLLAIANTVLGE